MNGQPRFTILGKLISFVLVLGLIGLGVYMIRARSGGGGSATPSETAEGGGTAPEVSEVKVEVPRLSPPAAFQFKDNIVPIEISEYAGYAGLIAANGGLEPTENSLFFKNHGFKVRLTISEDESWSEFNEGKMAASVTTVDVLAAYGKQLHAVVPAQIGFSRGADGIVVRSDIKRINQLKGKTIATAQFTEVDFFIRYLAQEAGLPINTLGSLDATPHPERLNLVYTEDGFGAGDLFLNDLKSGKNRLAGCVTWEPKVSEVVDGSGGQAHVLVTNRNLLIIADVLIVHRGFAQEQPEDRRGSRAGPARGQPHGPRSARPVSRRRRPVVQVEPRRHEERARQRAPVEPARERRVLLGGDRRRRQLRRASISRPCSPTAAISSRIRPTRAGSPASRRCRRSRRAASSRIRRSRSRRSARPAARSLEADPLLSKDIRFLFEANSSTLDMANQENVKNLEAIKTAAAGQPRVDAAAARPRRQRHGRRVPQAGRRGLRAHAWRCARWRSARIARPRSASVLVEKLRHRRRSASRSSAAAGKNRSGPNSDLNRRVEVQWFTIE